MTNKDFPIIVIYDEQLKLIHHIVVFGFWLRATEAGNVVDEVEFGGSTTHFCDSAIRPCHGHEYILCGRFRLLCFRSVGPTLISADSTGINNELHAYPLHRDHASTRRVIGAGEPTGRTLVDRKTIAGGCGEDVSCHGHQARCRRPRMRSIIWRRIHEKKDECRK